MTKSLGHQLATLEALNKPTHRDDETSRKAAERQAVKRFFEDAKAHIIESIAAGLRPAPFVLGTSTRGYSTSEQASTALKTFQWRMDDKVVPENSPYRDLWDQFASWAASENLQVTFESDHDGVGVRSWYNLCVESDKAKLGPPPSLAEGAVVLPKHILDRFGSAQAYLEHLQQKAGAA